MERNKSSSTTRHPPIGDTTVLQTHDEPRSRAGWPISAQASIALRGCPAHLRTTRGCVTCTARSSLPAPARRTRRRRREKNRARASFIDTRGDACREPVIPVYTCLWMIPSHARDEKTYRTIARRRLRVSVASPRAPRESDPPAETRHQKRHRRAGLHVVLGHLC